MKKCSFKIMPRQSGKTTRLINLYHDLSKENLEYPVYMVTPDHQSKKRYENEGVSRIYSIQEFIYKMNCYSPGELNCSHLILDEYFRFIEDQQRLLYVEFSKFVTDTVWIEATPVRSYDKKLIDLCRYVKMIYDLNLQSFGLGIELFNQKQNKDFEYLYDNFLTDPKTNLHIKYDVSKSIMNEETFEIEYLGKFYKEV